MAFYMIIMESQKQQLTKQIVNAQSIVISPLNIFLQSKYPECGRSGYLLYSDFRCF